MYDIIAFENLRFRSSKFYWCTSEWHTNTSSEQFHLEEEETMLARGNVLLPSEIAHWKCKYIIKNLKKKLKNLHYEDRFQKLFSCGPRA